MTHAFWSYTPTKEIQEMRSTEENWPIRWREKNELERSSKAYIGSKSSSTWHQILHHPDAYGKIQ